MAGNFTDAMRQSAHDFQRLILPIFKKIWRDCEFLHTEAADGELAKILDRYSGIDVLRINHKQKTVTGIAGRIQRADKCWETFTVRCKRDSNTPTEYFKRTCALQRGDIIPALTYQAYLTASGDRLSGLAVARTSDILSFLTNDNILARHTNPAQIGQAAFYVVRWRDMLRNNYELLRISPTHGGFYLQWSSGKKFIDPF